jgi:hypothetical protein
VEPRAGGLVAALAEAGTQLGVGAQAPYRVSRGGGVAERDDQPGSTISTAGGLGVVITGMPRAMYSTTLVGIECR